MMGPGFRWPSWVALAVLVFCGSDTAGAEESWSVTAYGAVLTADTMRETILLSADFEDAYLVAVALSRRIAAPLDEVELEVEGQVAKHFGDQHHEEYVAAILARWLPLPWDRTLDTSFAVGAGLSFASEVPEIEEQEHEDTARLLMYLVFEATLSHPRLPRWSLVGRLHHRSGAFGLFHDVRSASNGLALGIKHAF